MYVSKLHDTSIIKLLKKNVTKTFREIAKIPVILIECLILAM